MARADHRDEKRSINFTTEKKILLHSLDYAKYEDEFEVPFAISQEGIARAVGIRRDNVPRAMRCLKEDDVVYEKVVRVHGVKRRRKVYFLTGKGKDVAIKLRRLAEESPVTLIDEEGVEREMTMGEAVRHLLEHTTAPVSLASVVKFYVSDGKVDVREYVRSLQSMDEDEERSDSGRVSMVADAPRFKHFVGRMEELRVLNEFMADGRSRVMVIHGIAGIGKTTLAAKMMSGMEGKVDLLWYRFHRWDTVRNVLNALAEFLSQLNRRRLKGHLSSTPTVEMHEIARILEDDMADLPCVWFFDDYQRAKSRINELFGLLLEVSVQAKGPKMVVVGRRILPFYDRAAVLVDKTVTEMRLDGLDPEAARTYLTKKGVRPDKVDLIYQRTKGHPLFLELMSTATDLEDRTDLKRYIYEEIFQNLAGDEKSLLRIASVFRYPVSSSAFFVEEGMNYEVLDSLVERNLLQEMAYDQYDIHDIIREFFYTRLTPAKKQRYHRAASDYYLEEGSDLGALESAWHLLKAQDPAAAVSLLAKEGPNLIFRGYVSELTHVLEGLDPEVVPEQQRADYFLLLAKCLTVAGAWDRAIDAFGRAEAAGGATGNTLVMSEAHRELGHLTRHRGESEASIAHYRKALELSQGIDDMAGIADAYRGLGEIYGRRGEFDKALEQHERSLRYSVKAQARHILAKTYIDMGTIKCNMGDLEMAAEYHRKALDILEEFGNLQDKAKVSRNLGVVLARKGDLDAALIYFDEAIGLSESVGDLQGMGYALASAGAVHTLRKNPDIAGEYLDEALDIFKRLGMNDKAASVYLTKSELSRMEEALDESEELATRALTIFQDAGDSYNTARAHRQLALTYQDMEENEKAKRHRGMAEKMFSRMGISAPADGTG